MKAFQPLSSPSNNILDLPCQQTCLETWLPSQTHQKHHQVQKTNWWAFWKRTTRGRSISVMLHSKRKLFMRKNRRLFAVFVHYDKNPPFLNRHRANIEAEENTAQCSVGSDHYISVFRYPPQADTQPPPLFRAHSAVCDGRRGAIVPAREVPRCQHHAVKLWDPKAIGSQEWVAEPSPKGALFPSAQIGAGKWQGWQLGLAPSLDSSLFPLPVAFLLSFSPTHTRMLCSWSCTQTRGKLLNPGIRQGGRETWSPSIFGVSDPVTAAGLYLGVVEGGCFVNKKTIRFRWGAFFKLL